MPTGTSASKASTIDSGGGPGGHRRDGLVTDDIGGEALAEAQADAPGGAVIGVDSVEPRIQGAVLIWVAEDAAGCAGQTYAAPMPAAWDDVVSSAVALGGCTTFSHFETPDYTLAQFDCTCPVMYQLADETSSVRWGR